MIKFTLVGLIEMLDSNIKKIEQMLEDIPYNTENKLKNELLSLKRSEFCMQHILIDSVERGRVYEKKVDEYEIGKLRGLPRVENYPPMPECAPVKPEPPELVYLREDGCKRTKHRT
jgi:hypothetical protein